MSCLHLRQRAAAAATKHRGRISYRQIQYWDKTSFIKPSYRRRGKYRLYTFADLIQLRLAKMLRETNFSIQKLRKK